MDFDAKQIKKDLLLPEGEYDFVVLDAKEKRSQNGNDMLNLKLALIVGERRVLYWTTLMLMPKMFWQIEHFCQTTGMPEKIDEGRLTPDDCFGKEGKIYIIQKVDNQTGEMCNATKDFVKPVEVEVTPAPVAPATDAFDDDIPDLQAS